MNQSNAGEGGPTEANGCGRDRTADALPFDQQDLLVSATEAKKSPMKPVTRPTGQDVNPAVSKQRRSTSWKV